MELSQEDRDILTCISEGMPDHEVIARLKISADRLEETMDRVQQRAIQLDDGTSAAVYYERALRRRAENRITSLNARFHALMESSSEGIIVVNGRTGEIIDANKVAERMFGYPLHEIIGKSVEMLVPVDRRSVHVAFRNAFLVNVRKRQIGYHPPIFALTQDGKRIEIAIGLTASNADDNVMVVCSDQYRETSFERNGDSLAEPAL